ncbi:MAG TPA: dynamin family protein [bacterium]|nr:dynamin family protein [bacterium]
MTNDNKFNLNQLVMQLENIAKTHNLELPQNFYKIKARIKDPILYVGLVGEFSSGKSTLVNAWLDNKDLLKTDILQGTTAAPTVIKYSQDAKIDTLLKNGEWIYSKEFSPEKFSTKVIEFFHKITAKEEYSKDIKLVSLSYPYHLLKENVALIDTPGANADNPRHSQVTGWSVEQICDVAIVIIPADIPFSDSLSSFLKDHLSGSLGKCVFIVTKIDTVRSRRGQKSVEIEKLLSTIKKRIEIQLEIKVSEVIPFCPQIYLNSLDKSDEASSLSEEESELLSNQFVENKLKLFEVLKEKRAEFLFMTCSVIIEKLSDELKELLEDKKKKYQLEHKKIIDNILPDLDDWMNNKRVEYEKKLKSDVHNESLRWCEEYLIEAKRNRKESLIKEIKKIEDKNTLESYMNEQVPNYFNNEFQTVIKNDFKNYSRIYLKNKKRIFQEFGNDFSNIYRNLSQLNIESTVKVGSMKFESINADASIKEVSKGINNTENMAIGGGAGVGAFLGTLIFPGFGTVAGALLGAFLGDMFVSIDKRKQKYIDAVPGYINPQIDAIGKVLKSKLNKMAELNLKALEDYILEYTHKYKSLIEKMIAVDNENKLKLEDYVKSALKDIDTLSEKKALLQNTNGVDFVGLEKFSFIYSLPERFKTEPLINDSSRNIRQSIKELTEEKAKTIMKEWSFEHPKEKTADIKSTAISKAHRTMWIIIIVIAIIVLLLFLI